MKLLQVEGRGMCLKPGDATGRLTNVRATFSRSPATSTVGLHFIT